MFGTRHEFSRHGAVMVSLLCHAVVFGIVMFKLSPPALTTAANAETPAVVIEMVTLPMPHPVAITAAAPPPAVVEEPPPLIESIAAEDATPPPPKVERKKERQPQPERARHQLRAEPAETHEAPVETPPSLVPSASPLTGNIEPQMASASSGPPLDYIARLHRALERNKEYPRSARAQRQQGRAMLRFAIDRAGNVLDYRLEKSSGYDLLDREVVAMIQRASPLPPMPADMAADRLEIVVPIPFILR